MKKVIQGPVLKYGDNINTDIISPPQYMELSIEEASRYAMSGVDPDFSKKCKPGTILAVGYNFGSGSSRETSPMSLKYLGVQAIIAKSFARIFYRNAINLGLVLVECADTDDFVDGDILELSLEEGAIQNNNSGRTYSCTKLPPHLTTLIADGGLFEHLKKTIY